MISTMQENQGQITLEYPSYEQENHFNRIESVPKIRKLHHRESMQSAIENQQQELTKRNADILKEKYPTLTESYINEVLDQADNDMTLAIEVIDNNLQNSQRIKKILETPLPKPVIRRAPPKTEKFKNIHVYEQPKPKSNTNFQSGNMLAESPDVNGIKRHEARQIAREYYHNRLNQLRNMDEVTDLIVDAYLQGYNDSKKELEGKSEAQVKELENKYEGQVKQLESDKALMCNQFNYVRKSLEKTTEANKFLDTQNKSKDQKIGTLEKAVLALQGQLSYYQQSEEPHYTSHHQWGF